MTAFNDLNHELITLIADNLPVKAVARLSLTCKLGRVGAENNVRYNHVRMYKYVINDINNIKYMLYNTSSNTRIGSLSRKYRLKDTCCHTIDNTRICFIAHIGPIIVYNSNSKNEIMIG